MTECEALSLRKVQLGRYTYECETENFPRFIFEQKFKFMMKRQKGVMERIDQFMCVLPGVKRREYFSFGGNMEKNRIEEHFF